MTSPRLYYTAPTDEAFADMKAACLEVWGQYKDSAGGYMDEKVARIKDITNVQDNFMFMLAMFDEDNQRKVIKLLQDHTCAAVRDRLRDGGNSPHHIAMLGL